MLANITVNRIRKDGTVVVLFTTLPTTVLACLILYICLAKIIYMHLV